MYTVNEQLALNKFITVQFIYFVQTVQQPGDIIVTLYSGYHMGYNMGFSVSESVNYATENWKPYYEKAKQCSCE